MQVLMSRWLVSRQACFAVAIVACAGCRTTRNTISTWPGMGWVAQSETTSEQWSDEETVADAEPSLPARSATPQLATQDTPKSRGARQGTAGSAEYAYPNTGYPSPYDTAGHEGSQTERYPTGRYSDRPSSSATAEYEKGKERSTRTGGPQRGFYNEDYGDESELGASRSRAAETAAQPLPNRRASSSSRFSRNGADDSYSSDPVSTTTGQFARDAADSGDESATTRKTAAAARPAASNSRFSQSAVDSGDESFDQDATESSEAADDLASGSKRGYQPAAQELRGQLRDGARSLTDSARQISNATRKSVRDALQGADTDADSDVEKRPASRFTAEASSDSSSATTGDDAADPSSGLTDNAPADAGRATSGEDSGRQYSRFQNRFADTTTEPASEAVAPPASGEAEQSTEPTSALGQNRSDEVWLPGSTRRYTGDSLDQARRSRTSDDKGSVAPAAYRDGYQPRLSPAFR